MIKYLFLCFTFVVLSSNAQGKEWHAVIDLLQSEVKYFNGKSGFIQLGKSRYNTFIIEKFLVSDTLINFQIKMQDRFQGGNTEEVVEETLLFEPEMKINSAAINYNNSFYFEDFPDSQFLLLEFEENSPMIHQITATCNDIKTGRKDRWMREETAYEISLPIRSKNRERIFKAIENYQVKTLMRDLKEDKNH